jgi:hypothetical protein
MQGVGGSKPPVPIDLGIFLVNIGYILDKKLKIRFFIQ